MGLYFICDHVILIIYMCMCVCVCVCRTPVTGLAGVQKLLFVFCVVFKIQNKRLSDHIAWQRMSFTHPDWGHARFGRETSKRLQREISRTDPGSRIWLVRRPWWGYPKWWRLKRFLLTVKGIFGVFARIYCNSDPSSLRHLVRFAAILDDLRR